MNFSTFSCVFFGQKQPNSAKTVKTVTGAKVFHIDDILNYKDEIDVVVICGGSATDLPKQTPELAKMFNVQSIPMVALVKDNTFVDMSLGFVPKDKLAKLIEEYK